MCHRYLRRILLGVCVLITSGCQPRASEFRDGDIIFHTSRSAQSEAVQRATRSKYSHMGIIFFKEDEPYVFEAVSPVKFTSLQKWIDRGKNGRYVVKRLVNADAVMSAAGLKKLRDSARQFEGKPYDLTFEWSDDRIYCSELVWKMYDRALGIEAGRLQKLREFDLSEPLVKQKVGERYGARVPLDETVISPQAIFDSPNLVTIDRR